MLSLKVIDLSMRLEKYTQEPLEVGRDSLWEQKFFKVFGSIATKKQKNYKTMFPLYRFLKHKQGSECASSSKTLSERPHSQPKLKNTWDTTIYETIEPPVVVEK